MASFYMAGLLLGLCILIVQGLRDLKMMDYTNLGSSELKISKVCLGTMTWGQQNSLTEAHDQLDIAFDKYGVNFLDTAEIYPIPTKPETQGATDCIIAPWLKKRNREKVILATKVAGASEQITWLPGRDGKGSRVRKADIMVSVDESLKRLGTDYIDLLQIHWPDRYVPLFGSAPYNSSLEREYTAFADQLRALEEVIIKGKVRYIGLSNETPFGVMKFSQIAEKFGFPKPVSIQNSYSLIVRSDFESSLVEVCSPSNENLGLLAYSPLAGGILSGKYLQEDCPSTARLNMFPGYMSRFKQSLAQAAVKEYSDVAKKYGLTTTELALMWCYTRPHVASSIIGATSTTQLIENLNSYSKIGEINDAIIADVEDVYKRYRDPAKV